jgi:hypothetical protein
MSDMLDMSDMYGMYGMAWHCTVWHIWHGTALQTMAYMEWHIWDGKGKEECNDSHNDDRDRDRDLSSLAVIRFDFMPFNSIQFHSM